jgi:hypothetical protein
LSATAPNAQSRASARFQLIVLRSKVAGFVLPPPTIAPPPEPARRFHRSVWPLPGDIGAALPSLATVSMMTWLLNESRLTDTLAVVLLPALETNVPAEETPKNDVAPPTISLELSDVTTMSAVPTGGFASCHMLIATPLLEREPISESALPP